MDVTTTADAGFLEPERPPAGTDLASQLLGASQGAGKGRGAMVREMVKLARGPGKISPKEYFEYRLFDDHRLDFPAKLRFAGVRAHQRIWARCNPDPTYIAAVHDKLLFTALMHGLDLPVEPYLGIYGGTRRGRTPIHLATPDDLRGFLADPANYPLVGKPVDGRQSLGVVGLDRYDPATDLSTTSTGQAVPFARLAEALERYRAAGYLFQRRLAPHPDLASLHGPRIGTVRITTGHGPDGPELLFAAWKIPAGDNLADNFWRPGNLLASLDLATGGVGRIVRGVGVGQDEVGRHPDTQAMLEGFRLPFWAEIGRVALEAASALPHLRLLGWDIAIGAAGPLLLEANYRPALELHQYASAEGVLGDRFQAFLDDCARHPMVS